MVRCPFSLLALHATLYLFFVLMWLCSVVLPQALLDLHTRFIVFFALYSNATQWCASHLPCLPCLLLYALCLSVPFITVGVYPSSLLVYCVLPCVAHVVTTHVFSIWYFVINYIVNTLF